MNPSGATVLVPLEGGYWGREESRMRIQHCNAGSIAVSCRKASIPALIMTT
jgi:hypothetical protein